MLHKYRVLKALKGNAKRQTRMLLGMQARPKPPAVLSQPMEQIVARHSMICRNLTNFWPPEMKIEGASVCEIGPGDCLAAAAFFIGKGARHVDLVDTLPPIINDRQIQVLAALKSAGFPVATDVISTGKTPLLNESLVTYHDLLMEEYRAAKSYDFVVSHHVMEHVEDLDEAFKSAYWALRPGGWTLHFVDLGGHGEFEDPVPPLDFQTYPDWLFEWMYPANFRNTRRFVEDYRRAAFGAGFVDIYIQPTRLADKSYVEAIRKKLRPAARHLPFEQLGVIEFVLNAAK